MALALTYTWPMEQSLTGSLLVAEPEMDDHNFTRTVLAMVHHGDDGAMGFVLNRKGHNSLSSILHSYRLSPGGQLPIYIGGPVEPDRLFCIHGLGSWAPLSEHAMELAPGLVFEPSFDVVDQLLHDSRISTESPPIRLLIGYAGWSSGQLEREMAQGAWTSHRASAPLVFSFQGKAQWKAVLKDKGGLYSVVAQLGSKPSLN